MGMAGSDMDVRRTWPGATLLSSWTDSVVRDEEGQGQRGRASKHYRHGALAACEPPGVLILLLTQMARFWPGH
jgi:hypothetical protein